MLWRPDDRHSRPDGATGIVAANPEDDRALLVHRLVAGGALALVQGLQAAFLGVAAFQGKAPLLPLGHGSGVLVCDRRGGARLLTASPQT